MISDLSSFRNKVVFELCNLYLEILLHGVPYSRHVGGKIPQYPSQFQTYILPTHQTPEREMHLDIKYNNSFIKYSMGYIE